eukprot:CAMPEP_0197626970 /NCGR_PEP_ID=MMETSP1338-20131121/5719_1 /TAXON_ID=43686 ORGANISM="Pelagodinium beii, Strain RCC1491" /NCGR_SAMPLE_ID=MMETSP1338 /ASSEMBLY_ACC=CAM_ASM_000754 /LENGTH=158 /DNA_ID=CAMNT_0043197573 /DNA_START=58 /DNA_END=534 /DNA_ORIENTATION=-
MSRIACLLVTASAALYGASCFVAPMAPRSSPQVSSGATESMAAPSVEESSFSPLALGAAVGLLAAVMSARPVMAADLENGAAIFSGNCAACHAGGNNTIAAEKKLKKEALVTYGKYEVSAIIKQVTNGYGAMPAFGEKLGPDDIEDVANWVFDKADKW